ncbi:MAG TPA: ABC transporter ATP-binding protein [Ktedonobacterales bacterium]
MSDASPSAITFEDVSFGYRAAPVIERVSLRIGVGEMVALLGPNGAGKSTLVKLATGILRPVSGRVRLLGDDVAHLARDQVARRVAVAPQDFSVQFAYTVKQIVALGRLPHMGTWALARPDDQRAVDDALRETGTELLAERIFNELSGGERQRVLVALALAQRAGIIVLDEPTAHLDIKHQIEVLDLMRRLNRERGITVLAALHDLNLASRYFSRLVIFRHRIAADGPPSAVLDEELLSRVYETRVRIGILRGEDALSVMPPGSSVDPALSRDVRPARAHVLAGGGSGELLMRTLADAGTPFTVGPLNSGDSDCALAQRLGELCLMEPPYAPISPEGLAAAQERMLSAGAGIICPMPVGHGNIALLRVALDARKAGVTMVLLEPSHGQRQQTHGNEPWEAIAARDFTGEAAPLYRELEASGGIWAQSPREALAALPTEIVSSTSESGKL